MMGRERVIEIVVNRAAGQQEVPSFGAIREVAFPFKPVSSSATIRGLGIRTNGVRWYRIVEVEDRNVLIGVLDGRGAVGDVLGDEVLSVPPFGVRITSAIRLLQCEVTPPK